MHYNHIKTYTRVSVKSPSKYSTIKEFAQLATCFILFTAVYILLAV